MAARIKFDFFGSTSSGFDFPAPVDYRDGGAGFKQWVEDYVCVDIYPAGSAIPVWTRISDLPDNYRLLWLHQAQLCLKALAMENGLFKYNLLVFCWMRGEGKSLLVCLIQLWKFLNWPKQTIVLGANSKDQTKFVHFDIIRNIVLNSPKLLAIIGKRNVQEKEIRLRDGMGNVVSFIRPISSFSGIVSNITGYTFSEMFDMKNPKFFTQLDGSIRNIPNALGTIDSTVSDKGHILYKLWTQYVKGEITNMYFSHRESEKAQAKDFWNPNMTQEQLNNYKAKFLPADFDRYFKNVWGSGYKKSIPEALIQGGRFFGTTDSFWNPAKVLRICSVVSKLGKVLQDHKKFDGQKSERIVQGVSRKIRLEKEKLVPVKNLYTIDMFGAGADAGVLEKLGEKLDTDWLILGGVDRNDYYAQDPKARTVAALLAKGLVGSRSKYIDTTGQEPNYCYVLLRLLTGVKVSARQLKEFFLEADTDFDGLDMVCSERWMMADMLEWLGDNDMAAEPVSNSYTVQSSMFGMLYTAWDSGNFKYPVIDIPGYKGSDILVEEAENFVHDTSKKFFGSKEKFDFNGVQDDVLFAIALGMYGGRMMGLDSFRARHPKPWFGTMVMPTTSKYVNHNKPAYVI